MKLAKQLADRISSQLKQRVDDQQTSYRGLINALADGRTLSPTEIDRLNELRQQLNINPETVEDDIGVVEQHRGLKVAAEQSGSEVEKWAKAREDAKNKIEKLNAELPRLRQVLKQAEIFIQLPASQTAELHQLEAKNPRLFPRSDAPMVDVRLNRQWLDTPKPVYPGALSGRRRRIFCEHLSTHKIVEVDLSQRVLLRSG